MTATWCATWWQKSLTIFRSDVKLGQLIISPAIMALADLNWNEKTVLAAMVRSELAGEAFTAAEFASESGIGLRTIFAAVRILKIGGYSAQLSAHCETKCAVEAKEAPPSSPPASFPTPHPSPPLISPQESERARAKSWGDDPEFVEFWNMYHPRRRESKTANAKRWQKLDAETRETILSHVKAMRPEWDKENGKFCCGMNVYFNQERWHSQPTPDSNYNDNSKGIKYDTLT